MKTKRILAASTAAVLAASFAAVAAYAEGGTETTTSSNSSAATSDTTSSTTSTTTSSTTSDTTSSTTSTTTSSTTSDTTSTPTSTPATTTTDPVKLSNVNTENGTNIGAGVKVQLTDDDVDKIEEKYENFKISAESVSVASTSVEGKEGSYVDTDDDAVKGLDKAIKKELAKVKIGDFKMINIDLADGSYAESTSPVPVKITVTVPFDAKVYHVSGKTVEKLKTNNRKLANGGYEVSFTTKNFSPFIFTTADLKNANATTSDNEPTSTPATSSGSTTNPDTGIALAIAPVVLAAGAVAVVALKKKH